MTALGHDAWVSQVRERPCHQRRTLGEAFQPSDNAFSLLRLVFAFAVLVSHARPLGFGVLDPGLYRTHGQTSLGEVALLGFFVISGFLITRSADRLPAGRYLWHRALRILPGYWVCLLVVGLVVAPSVALIEHVTVRGTVTAPDGSLAYVLNNCCLAIRQPHVGGLLLNTPFGRLTGQKAFNGSLWTLLYEALCYLAVAALAATAILRRRWVLLAVGVVAFLTALVYLFTAPAVPGPQGPTGSVLGISFTVVPLELHPLMYLSYTFLLGALCYLYRDRIPLHTGLAALACVIVIGTLQFGAFAVLGYPAFAYLVIWLAIRLPRRLRGVGRERDYSYGFYIYAFPVQQILALAGIPRLGMVAYLWIATVITATLAAASWHLIERPAMSLKGWTWRNRRRPNLVLPEPEPERLGVFAADANSPAGEANAGQETPVLETSSGVAEHGVVPTQGSARVLRWS